MFISSTSRDLKEFREILLKEIGKALDGVGMEFFIPRGESSQKDSIDYLKKCDIVIFFITPYYGSLMDVCELRENCKSTECPMKTGEGKISFTHCEFKTTIAEGILHQTYLIEKDWDLIDYLKKVPENEFDVEKIKELDKFKDVPNSLIEKYYKIGNYANKLRNEVSKEAYGRIEGIKIPETLDLVKKNLANQIVEWHYGKKINFQNFIDRRRKLKELIENVNSKISINGIGGIGKTSLVQIALLIQKLKGEEFICIGTRQSYSTGSGYKLFIEKCKDSIYEIFGDIIELSDIADAFSKKYPILKKLLRKSKPEIIYEISEFIERKNIQLCIDDFHYVDEDVKNLVKTLKRVTITSRINFAFTDKDILVYGVEENERIDLVNLYCDFFNMQINEKIKNKILEITEGHPVATQILIKNYQKIDFDALEHFNLKDSSSDQESDFYRRVYKEVLSDKAYKLIKFLSSLNTNLNSNIDRNIIELLFEKSNIRKIFNKLIDVGILLKKDNQQTIYDFSYQLVKDALSEITDNEDHKISIKYYELKSGIQNLSIDDEIERLYHEAYIHPNSEIFEKILKYEANLAYILPSYQRLIDIGNIIVPTLPEKKKGLLFHTFGNIYSLAGNIYKMGDALMKAYKIYERQDLNDEENLHIFGLIQNNLGIFYQNISNPKEAESYYLKSLKDLAFLNSLNPNTEKILLDLSHTLHNLGILYYNRKKYKNSEKYLNRAYSIRNNLALHFPNKFSSDLAKTSNSLAITLSALKKYKESLNYHLRSKSIFERLSNIKPNKYLPELAGSNYNLGNFHHQKLGNYPIAENFYLKSLDILRELIEDQNNIVIPKLYEMIGNNQNSLGQVYTKLKMNKKAKQYFQKAIETRKFLVEINQEKYSYSLCSTYINLANIFFEAKKCQESKKIFLTALDVAKNIETVNPEKYKKVISIVKSKLDLIESLS